jgi:hypothetical protein
LYDFAYKANFGITYTLFIHTYQVREMDFQ